MFSTATRCTGSTAGVGPKALSIRAWRRRVFCFSVDQVRQAGCPPSPTARMAMLLSWLRHRHRIGLRLGGGSLPLEIRKGAFRFGRKRFLKSGDQSLTKRSARVGLLISLELRHSQIKKRIGIERPFPGAFLK